jgi:hypothetical protein
MLRSPLARFSPVIILLFLAAGAARAQDSPPAQLVQPPVERGIVYVLDGSGRLRLMAEDLARVAAEANLPLEVAEFNWSHGDGRIFFDLRSRSNHCARGEQLAGTILARRTACPGGRVIVITHSAGAAVALAAAERLPDGCIDRIILLAPAVSPGCDIKHACRASRQGVDVFYSPIDGISRGLALTGTADGWNVFSAGANGFDAPAAPCGKLRQHSYNVEMSKTGHLGGHYGWTKIGFLREYLVPMLATTGDPTVAAAPTPESR